MEELEELKIIGPVTSSEFERLQKNLRDLRESQGRFLNGLWNLAAQLPTRPSQPGDRGRQSIASISRGKFRTFRRPT